MARLTTMLAAVIAIAATLALAGGCGSDDNSEASGANGDESIKTSSLSEEEFIERANDLCRKRKVVQVKKVTAYLEGLPPQKLPEDIIALKAIRAVVIPTTESQIAAIRRLGAPAGDEEEIASALNAQEEAIQELRAKKRLRGDELPTDPFAEATKQLRDYGLKNCIFFP